MMNLGLIGSGFMGGVHMAAMEKLSDARLLVLASRTKPSPDAPKRGNLDAKQGTLPPDAEWTPDWQTVVNDPRIYAVDICLPTFMHKEVTLAALRNGKHVFCEKPMAVTPEDCAELIAAAKAAGRTLMIGQVLRFMFPYQYAKRWVKEVGRDNLTRVLFRRATGFPQWTNWLRETNTGGGAILDLLCHDYDQTFDIFGEPVSVSGVSDGEIDTVRSTLHYADGLNVQVDGGWYQPEMKFSASYEIATADKTLIFREGKLTVRTSVDEAAVNMPEDEDAYHAELSYFLDCCRTGQAPALCPPESSADAVALAETVRRSREQNGAKVLWKQ